MAAQSQVLRARLHLLSELRAGSRPPGAPISVKDTAAALKLSHTPVREALARLAGEGAVTVASERNGFSVPVIGYSGYRQRVDLLRLLFRGVLDASPLIREAPPRCDAGTEMVDPVAAIESTLAWIIGDHDNIEVVRMIGRTGTVLAPYRRIEPSVMPDWTSELMRLRADIAAGSGEATMCSYWDARLEADDPLPYLVRIARKRGRRLPPVATLPAKRPPLPTAALSAMEADLIACL